jgi:hypothetical protein
VNTLFASLCRFVPVAVVLLALSDLGEGKQQDSFPIDRNGADRRSVPHDNSASKSGGGGSSTGANGTPASFAGTPYIVSIPAADVTLTGPEAEEFIAVDPNTSTRLVASISDFTLRGGSNTTKFAYSSDNGATWASSFVPLLNGAPATRNAAGDGITSWPYNSDPVVAMDLLGNVYLANLYFNSSRRNNSNGVFVSVGSFNASNQLSFQATATYPVAVNWAAGTTSDEDKEWIAVDNSLTSPNSGNVYLAWAHFDGNYDHIAFSCSTNHGASWSLPLRISPSSQDGGVQGAQVAVGPDGTVFVAYEVFYIGGRRQQFLCYSTNGGGSFSVPVAVTPQFNELSFSSTYRKNSFCALAVQPAITATTSTYAVYMVYADQPNSTVGAEVEFVRIPYVVTPPSLGSPSAPVVINNASAGHQFMPALTVDASGTIHASWFDTRRNPTSSSLYDIFATYSLDNGATFAPNQQVTTTQGNAGGSSFIGDYSGIAAAGGYAHPVWTSGGLSSAGSRLDTAALQIPPSGP